MFALIFGIVYTTFLIVVILIQKFKNYRLEQDNQLLSLEVNKLLKENSKLRKELKNVLQIEPEGTRRNKKSTEL